MPKVKWGDAIDQASIDEAENNRSGDYTGDLPPAGVYRFKLKSSKKDVSNEGNPKLFNVLILDGSYKPEHAKYDGCPMFEHLPVTKKTAFRVRAFCDALNVTSKEFMNKMIVDDDGYVQKIGNLTIADENRLVLAKVTVEKSDGYDDKLGFGKSGGYIPFKEEDDDDDDTDDTDADTDDDDDDEPPF